MKINTRDVIGRTLVTTGVWEPDITCLCRRLLRPGDVCVDVGANIGYFTILASRLVGEGGHVYALEPYPDTFRALSENLRLNGLSNVTPLKVAAGARDGRAAMNVPPAHNPGLASLRGTDPLDPSISMARVTVDIRVLDTLVSGTHARRLRLVKIDVEGHEVDVVQGLEGVLASGSRPFLIVELTPHLWRNGEATVLRDLCLRHSLQAILLVEGVGGARMFAPIAPEDLGEQRGNVLLIPHGGVASRPSSAR